MFLVTKLLALFLDLGNLSVLFLLLSVFLLRRRGRPVRILELWAAFCLVIWLTPVPDLLLTPLEEAIPQPALPAKIDGVIVLGGWEDTLMFKYRNSISTNDSAERFLTALDLAHRYPDAKVVLTGGIGSLIPGSVTEADVARRAVQMAGLPERNVVYENRSRNTLENALYSRDLVKPQPGQTWVLITSASHILRAKKVFEKAGWQVLPYPCDYRAVPISWVPSLDFIGSLNRFRIAGYEYSALLVYRAFGRID